MPFHLENLKINSSVMKYGQYKSVKRKFHSSWSVNKKQMCDLNSQENLTLKCTETCQKDSPILNYNLAPCNSECSKQGNISISDLSAESSSSVKTCEISSEDICDSNNSKKNDISNMTKTVDKTFKLPIVFKKERKSADAISLPKNKSNYLRLMSSPTDCLYEINSSLKRKQMNSFFSLPPYNIFFPKNINIGFIDTHCHLDLIFKRERFQGTYEKYQLKNYETFPKNYEGCITVFCNPQSFAKKSEWKKLLKEKNVWAAFGCHPHSANEYNDDIEKHLLKALVHPKVVALGEIGLDYSSRNSCQPSIQRKVFQKQLKIAVSKNLPLVIHCRDAEDDCLEILKKEVPSNYYIHRHCFTGNWKVAKIWLSTFENLYIGITNLVTFPSAKKLHVVAKKISLNRLLLETDAPYFVPKHHTTKKVKVSHPGMAIHVAAQISALRSKDTIQDILHAVRKNTLRLYKV
ncbi:putative deoxyribonuclease TATDN2 [Centruroides vittatus]|uniref:putative deoxyribonuclease TATDN2 n=1 Tax=Centruroides vittatus TaxID=120091 RepID=UPI00350F64BF